jgi:hypothetical protein
MHRLTSVLDGGEWSAARTGRFTPMDRAPGKHWIGGWVGPRAGLDTMSKRKIPSPCWESNPDDPIAQSVASHYTDWAIPAIIIIILIIIMLRFSLNWGILTQLN